MLSVHHRGNFKVIGYYTMIAVTASNNAISVRATELLSTQKKFSIDLLAGGHQQLKIIAAAHGTTVRDLILDGLVNYTFPKYMTNKES